MSKQTRILITGANGFIGSHLLKYFSGKKEYRVSGLVRKSSNLFRLQSKTCKLRYASINDPLEDIVRGFDVLIHTAGKTSDWGSYGSFYKANVEGALNVLQASIKKKVRRFIHFSSTVVYGFDGNFNTGENKRQNPFPNYYCLTKAAAEEKLLRFKDAIELIIIRPSNVFGPYDTTTTYPLIRAMEKGLIGFPEGGKRLTSPCYVKNLVIATEKALLTENGLGEAFNISDGTDIPWREYLLMIAERLHRKPPRLVIPAKPLFFISFVLEKLFRLFNSLEPPFITSYRIAQVAKDYSFSIEKAKRLLHYNPPYTTKEGIRESVAWYNNYKKTSLRNMRDVKRS